MPNIGAHLTLPRVAAVPDSPVAPLLLVQIMVPLDAPAMFGSTNSETGPGWAVVIAFQITEVSVHFSSFSSISSISIISIIIIVV